MKTLILYILFIFYMLYSLILKLKLSYIRKNGTKEEAERYVYLVVKNWSQFIVDRVGIKVELIGREHIPEGSCLFVANHQGAMDIPVLLASIDKPIGFIAKVELLKIPIISYWMKQIHCIFMDRSNIRESVKSIAQGAEFLAEGYNLVIFPEGTRSRSSRLGEFKKGSMKLGIKGGVPIVPIAIDGTYKAREANGNKLKPTDVRLTVCAPIYPETLSKEEQGQLAETIKNIIAENVK